MQTGKVVTGHVLDCNKKHLEKALKDYDKQLYLKWNPDKANKVGMWEVRRKPNQKTAWPMWELGDSIVFDLKYVENDIENHVMDVPFLNYNILKRIKEMDTWVVHDYVNDLEYREQKAKDKAYDDNRAELRYAIKHNKRAMRDLQELAKSGRLLDALTGNW